MSYLDLSPILKGWLGLVIGDFPLICFSQAFVIFFVLGTLLSPLNKALPFGGFPLGKNTDFVLCERNLYDPHNYCPHKHGCLQYVWMDGKIFLMNERQKINVI